VIESAGYTPEYAQERLEALAKERYAADIFD
jgi:hypothetical protein